MGKKILLLSTWDDQGSGTALYRMSKVLLKAGYEAALVVRDKSQADSFVIQVPALQKFSPQRILYSLRYRNNRRNTKIHPDYDFLNINEDEKLISSERIIDVLPFTPDLILAGLTSNFVNTETLVELKEKTKADIYMWTVDMSPLTGGCHFAWDCKGYQTDCNNCPAIISETKKDRARKNLQIKLKNVRKADIQILAGSGWTLSQAQSSALFKPQKHIYNTNSFIDTSLFNAKHRNYAKRIFGLPEDSKVIFAGSTFTHVKRKGMLYFIDALSQLWNLLEEKDKSSTFILIAGNHTVKNDLVEQIPFQKQLISYIKDNRLLSLAYQASDIFVCPSIEDSGPMMVSEALACGTPVVGFEMGVTSNMVRNGYNGYKARLKDSADLAAGMFEVLTLAPEKYAEYSRNAINQVEEFSSYKLFLSIIDKILNQPSA